MGNCQAIDNATLVIQHPCGRVDKLYWPVTANEVMKLNPGHYVALLLTTTTATATATATLVRITRIKLLRPTDTLVIGKAYRLITTEEVRKGLWAKKYAKMRRKLSETESGDKQENVKEKMGSDFETANRRSEMEKTNQVLKHERHRPRPRTTTSTNSTAAKSKAWQPSLHSISEAGS
ncbi:hypothetical protein HYC85_004663 [Camellia sinensis]|uniref:Uncharacterized protein n=1 Tax=Camellia sinensis TaxID=4442 RepID=A0A7J7HZV6_CAMSI|nr:hypothetical protein HYC85_004663 [Camellia sinensis]